jgi:hypothetical protein
MAKKDKDYFIGQADSVVASIKSVGKKGPKELADNTAEFLAAAIEVAFHEVPAGKAVDPENKLVAKKARLEKAAAALIKVLADNEVVRFSAGKAEERFINPNPGSEANRVERARLAAKSSNALEALDLFGKGVRDFASEILELSEVDGLRSRMQFVRTAFQNFPSGLVVSKGPK